MVCLTRDRHRTNEPGSGILRKRARHDSASKASPPYHRPHRIRILRSNDEPLVEQAVGGFGCAGKVVHDKAGDPAGRAPEGRGGADGEAAGKGGEGRCREVPGAERRVGERIFERDEVEDRNVTRRGEGAVAAREVERTERRGLPLSCRLHWIG